MLMALPINMNNSRKYTATIPLLLALLASVEHLPAVIFVETIIIIYLAGTYTSYIVLIGAVMLYLINNLINENDIRYLLPFIFYFFIQAIPIINKNQYKNNGINKILIVWWLTVSAFIYASIFIPSFLSTDVYEYYSNQNLEIVLYDFDDRSQYRTGAYYFNPNQFSYIVIIFLLFAKSININSKLIHCICLLTIIFTQSRALLLIYIIYNINIFKKKYFYIGLPFTFPIGYIIIEYLFSESRINSNLTESLDHAAYKFIILDRLSDVKFINLMIGSGYNKLVAFDADFGSMIYYYGVFLAALLLILIFLKLNKIIGILNSALFYLSILYGTIFTNTRMVTVTGGIVCLLLLVKESSDKSR